MVLFATLDPPTNLGLMVEGLRQLYSLARPRLEDFAARLSQMPPTEGPAYVDLATQAKGNVVPLPKIDDEYKGKGTAEEDPGANRAPGHPATLASVQPRKKLKAGGGSESGAPGGRRGQ